jgi:hypothetical protein
MTKHHVGEYELAEYTEDADEREGIGHLSWCRECQNVAAEYRWLQRELGAGLHEEADQLEVPRANWRAVARRLVTVRRRAILARCGSLAASVLIMSGVIAVTGSLPGAAPGEVTLIGHPPAPRPIVDETRSLAPEAFSTPGLQRLVEDETGSLTPAVVPLPTPPVDMET